MKAAELAHGEQTGEQTHQRWFGRSPMKTGASSVAIAAVVSQLACLQEPTFRDNLERYTRHFEAVEGTLRHDITFVPVGAKRFYDWCGASGRYLQAPGAWIEYDLNCTSEDPREMAVHEVCHQKLGHHEKDFLLDVDPLARKMMESEAEECAAQYRDQ